MAPAGAACSRQASPDLPPKHWGPFDLRSADILGAALRFVQLPLKRHCGKIMTGQKHIETRGTVFLLR